jgi:hypothetical protein
LEKGALSREELCSDPTVVGEVTRLLARHAAQQKLAKFETPQAVSLVSVSPQIFTIFEAVFLALLDPDPLVRGTDPDPDPSTINQKYSKNLNSYCFFISS